MTWLAPLGFLGLIGLIILIIIYIIKPNYQVRYISTTYVWKRSLKFKKKKLPLNKLRNILLFLCQIAVLIGTTCIIAQPFIQVDTSKSADDMILIIDASASMHAENNAQSRLERAADAALAEATKAMNAGKQVSVILASEQASFLVQQAGPDKETLVYDVLEQIQIEPHTVFTYGKADVEGAIKLAEQITAYSKQAQVILYTDTTYLNAGNVNVYNVTESAEWNAAILDVRASMVENYYRVEVDVASYGADNRLTLECEITNFNESDTSKVIEKEVYCSGDAVTTFVMGYVSPDMPENEAALINETLEMFSYDSIYVTVSCYDSLDYDNRFCLFGGNKPVLKVLYYSTMPNAYWASSLLVLEDIVKNEWDVQIDELTEGDAPVEGYDIYIYEHTAPSTVPDDGVVIYSDPKDLPAAAGVRLGSAVPLSGELFMNFMEEHPVTAKMNPERISVTMLTTIASSDGYVNLLGYDENPLVMLKEDVDQTIIVMPFSLHYSNIALQPDFPLLMKNVVSYFFPVTLEEYVYDVNQNVTLNARGDTLNVVGPEVELELEAFPYDLKVTQPGTYTLTQTAMSGDLVIENFFVKIPAAESNIFAEEGVLTNPYFFEEKESVDVDLLFYFALAVVSLLFIEWWLKSREQN